jgi:pyrroloquinoline quinone biosynthesis protein B
MSGRRSTAIEGILLTNADLDHVLGLWSLREGGALRVHATAAVWQSLRHDLGFDRVMGYFGGCQWLEAPWEPRPLLHADGAPSGLRYSAFPVLGKPPRYVEGRAATAGDNVGLRIEDLRTGGRLVFAPDLRAVGPTLQGQLADCELALLDGTFWTEGELQDFGGRAAAAMAHLPLGGPNGSLAALPAGPKPRRVFVHINNTNPVLREDSPERAELLRSGAEVGADGQEFEL